jgi:hypothetical protein
MRRLLLSISTVALIGGLLAVAPESPQQQPTVAIKKICFTDAGEILCRRP